jgi:menaquinone-dependent protoporphyrinogen oxidase
MTMKVLVSAASKYGSTEGIAAAIAEVLTAQGATVELRRPEEVDGVGDYQGVVLGSAVYAGHWMREAKELAARLPVEAPQAPVWLFSSGPIGDPPKPTEDPVDVADLLALTNARGHQVFAGKLEHRGLSFGERAIVIALRAADGDFRDWDQIGAWASEIAGELNA